MTRPEITGKREIDFSKWVRSKLPDSATGFMVSDIDFYIYNYKTKNHALVEVKTYTGKLKRWQSEMYDRLSKWIGEGGKKDGWNFIGFFLINFEKKDFSEGKVYLNGVESSEEEIKQTLSLENDCNKYPDIHWSLRPIPEKI